MVVIAELIIEKGIFLEELIFECWKNCCNIFFSAISVQVIYTLGFKSVIGLVERVKRIKEYIGIVWESKQLNYAFEWLN